MRRRGKWIVLDLDAGRHLVFHLGMTGQLTVTDATVPLQNHTHLVFDLESSPPLQLRFRDVRRFGSATLHEEDGAWEVRAPRTRVVVFVEAPDHVPSHLAVEIPKGEGRYEVVVPMAR